MNEKLNNEKSNNNSAGTLVIQTTEAENAIPIQGALALVTKYEDGGTKLYAAVYTDENGRTPPINLPSPFADESLDPAVQMPYEIYYVRVSHPGYYIEENHMVQIFGSSNSFLGINMIPLPEYGDKDVIMY